jgi:hypothetical protein
VLRNYEATSNERVGRQVLASEANGHSLVGRDRRIRRDQHIQLPSIRTPTPSLVLRTIMALDLGRQEEESSCCSDAHTLVVSNGYCTVGSTLDVPV